ncbi:MAG TPA: YbaK/EbsC family protein [Clostridia bacterium]|nr:YbaK/EbsC family protein [Clostridia bacterium]
MSLNEVKLFFKEHGREGDVVELGESSATVDLAASALDVEPGRIAKTLAVWSNDQPMLLVIAGDHKLDNRKFKNEFNQRMSMLKFKEVEEITGHPVGGVCPFGNNNGLPIYLDISLKAYNTIFPACGSENSMIELTSEELEKYSYCEGWVDVATPYK